ncbi:MAG TPA: FAD:protein FMN transferase [Variovorax sp.]|nr:FAD:protein FMN transferase [Variovorax sp.]
MTGLSFAVRRHGAYANAAVPRRADPASLQSLAGSTMGTSWSLRFDNPALLPLEAVRASALGAFQSVIAQMSTWEPDSQISRYNRAAPGSIHRLKPEFAQVLGCALHWAQASEGAIDPTVGPLIGLWGFGEAAATPVGRPSPDALRAAHLHVGWQRLAFDAQASTLAQPGGCMLDLSGIAKGFAVDHAAAALRDLGLRNFLLEVGGELRACGRRPGGLPWQVRIDAGPGLELQIALCDMAIATSGDRWHAHTDAAGQRWSHTIDPRSGQPATPALAAVSVLHHDCMQADALATLLAVLGPDEGLNFAERHALAALFVVRTGERPHVQMSRAWPHDGA